MAHWADGAPARCAFIILIPLIHAVHSSGTCPAGQHYTLNGNQCKQNVCTCTNGEKKTGATCTTDGAHMCASCNTGYTLNGNLCQQNVSKSYNSFPAATIEGTTTTRAALVGQDETPVVILDSVLPNAAYLSLREGLRNRVDFFEGVENGVTFPGKIAKLDWNIVDPLIRALLDSDKVREYFPRKIFEQREYIRGFASVQCYDGWVHQDFENTKHDDVVAPAAVFYIGFDGTPTQSTETGTKFLRETGSRLERFSSVRNKTEFCLSFPSSFACHKYIDNTRFEETFRVVGKPNRMILYPQDVLHNSWVDNSKVKSDLPISLPCSPKEGRLAISLFFLALENGKEITKSYETAWKSDALDRLLGVHPTTLHSSSRLYVNCPLFEPRQQFYSVNTSACSLQSTIIIENGNTLRIKGQQGLIHPQLDRGGQRPSGTNTEISRHFIVNENAALVLVNLKLTGAYVGHYDSSCTGCTYCHKPRCQDEWSCDSREIYVGYSKPGYGKTWACCNSGSGSDPPRCTLPYSPPCCTWGNGPAGICEDKCDDSHKGGAIRLQGSSSTTTLVDVIFESNIAYDDSGSIFSTKLDVNVYFLNMDTPFQFDPAKHGFFPQSVCDETTLSLCNELNRPTCCPNPKSSSSPVTAKPRALLSLRNPRWKTQSPYSSPSSRGACQQRPDLDESAESGASRRPYPYGIFDIKGLGSIRHEVTVESAAVSRSEICCAKNFSAVWDKRGKLVVAVIDQFFCDTEYRRVLDSMLDPQQWYWEDEPAATHRMRQDIEGIGPRNNGAKPGRHHRPELYNYNDTRDSPSLLGNAADAAFEDQFHENIKTCLRQTLPSDVLRSTDSLVYRRGYGSIAHLEPDGVSPVQSAPHVGAFDFVSEYTVTPDRRFERAGTIFVEQKGTGVFQVRTEAQRRAFYEANREIQRIAVEDEGQPYASGWMNASETRWGVGKLMVYNRANRIFFYPQGRPHNDFLPRKSMLSPTSEKGRMLLKSFWSIEN